MANYAFELRDEASFLRFYNCIREEGFSATVDRIYVPVFVLKEHMDKAVFLTDKLQGSLFAALPDMIREKDRAVFLNDMEFVIEKASGQGLSGVLMRCMEELAYFKDRNDLLRMADGSLYQLNTAAVQAFSSMTEGFTLSSECTWYEHLALLNALSKEGDRPSMVDLCVYGRGVLMVSANCVKNSNNRCDHTTGFGNTIVDRKNSEIPFLSNCSYCQNVLFNAKPLSLHNKWDQVKKLPDWVTLRITFTTESREQIRDLLAFYASDFTNGEGPADYTTGHFIKGVL